MIRQYILDETQDLEILSRTVRPDDVEAIVADIIADVRENGDAALIRYGRRFDKAEDDVLEVAEEEIEAAFKEVDPELIKTMEASAANIRFFHEKQVREGFRLEKEDGVVLGQKVTPIAKVGIYVPGGTAAYPSTVLMNAIPAKIAGCREIVMVTPAKGGVIKPSILAAARIAGVTRIFKVGGAQAVAALAYGTETVPQVDKIVGPGNSFVAEAKKQVFGQVAIDMIAGPSEILVVADETNDPARVAADLLSQAEHDAFATAVLITDSRTLADEVASEIEKQLAVLPREEIARASIENNGKIIIVKDIREGIAVANRLAPEHFELCVDDPFPYLDLIENAGSVFLGKYCPEALGDYFAGPNHTLPTSGTARFYSPLSVDDFVKRTQFSYYTKEALEKCADDIARFAREEGLEAHARSALSRK